MIVKPPYDMVIILQNTQKKQDAPNFACEGEVQDVFWEL